MVNGPQPSLAVPDPLHTGTYRLEIISAVLQRLLSLIDKRLCVEGLATQDYPQPHHAPSSLKRQTSHVHCAPHIHREVSSSPITGDQID